jgi:hypothetical protein
MLLADDNVDKKTPKRKTSRKSMLRKCDIAATAKQVAETREQGLLLLRLRTALDATVRPFRSEALFVNPIRAAHM